MRHVGLALFVLAVALLPVRAEEGEADPAAVTEAVRAAHAAGDATRLAALAGAGDPDAWVLADELLHQGAVDAAVALTAAREPADAALAAYVGQHADRRVDDTPSRHAVAIARLALGLGARVRSPSAALAALADTGENASPVLDVRIDRLRGRALAAVRRYPESADAYARAAEAAEALDWHRAAYYARRSAFRSLGADGDWRAAAEAALATSNAARALGDDRHIAESDLDHAAACRHLGRYDEALRHLSHALELHGHLQDEEGRADVLANLGVVRRHLGALDEALRLQREARAVYARLGAREKEAATLGNLGVVHESRGEYRLALEVQREALALKAACKDWPGYVLTLGEVGTLHVRLGDYDRALAVQQRAHAMTKKLRDRAGEARALHALGRLHQHFGRYPQAIEELNRARDLFAALGLEPEVGVLHQALGNVYRRLGRLDLGVEHLERALAIHVETADVAGRAATQTNLGLLLRDHGRYPRALAAFEAAEALAGAAGDRATQAAALGGLGGVYHRLGDHERAREHLRAALAAAEATEDPAALAALLVTLGAVQAAQEEPEEALDSLLEARRIQEGIRDRTGAAGTLTNMGLLNLRLGRIEKALGLQREAKAAAAEAKDDATAARCGLNLAYTLEVAGRRTRAREGYTRALSEGERLGLPDVEARALWGLARLDLADGKPRDALRSAHLAIDRMAILVRGQAEEQGAHARSTFIGLFATGARAALAAGDVRELAFFLESGRAGALLEALGGRHGLRADLLPAELLDAETAARATERTASARLALARDSGVLREVRRHHQALERAREAVRDVVERIQREAKNQADVLYPTPDPLERIQARLGEDERLLLYGLFDRGSIALVIGHDTCRVVELPPHDRIAEACWEAVLDDEPYVDEEAVARLHTMIAEPLALPASVKRVFVSPDGAIGYVPFCLLLPRSEVVYVPSGTTLGALAAEAGILGTGVLALGDPDYGLDRNARADGTYVRGSRRGLVPLPGTRKEAKAVGDVVLLGPEASETGLATALATRPRWRAVHLACHGLIDPSRPTLSSLALSTDLQNDGFLTALEIVRLPVPADVVVLSACETARGRVVRGEGIVGLTRAFMLAGSPRVIASLWEVDDAATKALMTRFYARWNPDPEDGAPGVAPATALRDAQAHVAAQEKWKHPKFWAAWVLWGLAE